jgi:hypothetical protein
MRYQLPAALAIAATILVMPPSAGAQSRPGPDLPSGNPDFLFGRPEGSVSVRTGWVFNRAGSDWFDFVTDQLTIDKGQFNNANIGVDVAVALTPRLDVVGSMDFSKSAVDSEYRDLVDNNRLPITQRTDLQGLNLGASVKYSLTPRGREVGRLAWVPNTVIPFVGAGGGVYWFRLRQAGDFVDYVDLSVFTDVFRSTGWTPSAHVFGGSDIKLYRRLYLTVEARYIWANADLGADWIDFDPLDLSGLRLGTGINVVF